MQQAQQRAMKMVEGWSTYPMRRAEGTGLVQPGEQIALGTLGSFASTYRKIIKKLEPGYLVLRKARNKSMDVELKEKEVQAEYKEPS